MAIFTGKIIEAYYTNTDNTCVEVIYQDGKQAINHYLPTDPQHPDFQDLMKEYPASRLEESTVARNKAVLNQLNRVVEGRMNARNTEKVSKADAVINFVIDYSPKKHADDLFDMKIGIFELPIIKENADTETKNKIRQASTPLEVLMVCNDILPSSK